MSKKSIQSDTLGELSSFIIPSQELRELKLISKRGASAFVYSSSWNDQPVAVKKFSEHTTGKETKEILIEAEIMLKVSSKSSYLMPLKGICIEPESNYYAIVMELMPKGSLYDLLQADQKLPWTIRYQIACDVSYGLCDLHGQNFIHRDLKSFNILLDDRLRAKLTDFGIAKPIGPDFTQTILKTGDIPNGSVPWMAPELFKKGSSWTKKADIYSLGMVLLELVTCKMPEREMTWKGTTLISISDAEIPEMTCPPELKQLIKSCQKTPSSRPTAIKVIKKLEPLLAAEQLKAKLQSLENEKRQQAEQHQLEMQQLKKEMEDKMTKQAEQLKIAEQEITQLKQKIQELQQKKKEIKLDSSSPISTTPSTTNILLAAHNPFILTPVSKAQISPEQLKLQDDLILACEHGDEKEVKNCLSRRAKPDIANAVGKHPLGAAVWGMNPEVVNILLKQLGNVSPMTWVECKEHNRKHYKEIFIVEKFSPKTFDEWNGVLQKIDHNPFIHTYHLQKADKKWHDNDTSSWENWKKFWSIKHMGILIGNWGKGGWLYGDDEIAKSTEEGYEDYRIQIKKKIRAASVSQEQVELLKEQDSKLSSPPQTPAIPSTASSLIPTLMPTAHNPQLLMSAPKIAISTEQLKLQNTLILACEYGDAKEVKNCLSRGAKPNIANAVGKHPLGAAVWGMNPEVVNELLEHMGDVSPMTWIQCKAHNKKYYKEVFIVENFPPHNSEEWKQLLRKIDPNPCIRTCYLQKADEKQHNHDTLDWEKLDEYIDRCVISETQGEGERLKTLKLYVASSEGDPTPLLVHSVNFQNVEQGYEVYKMQIKQKIEQSYPKLRSTWGLF